MCVLFGPNAYSFQVVAPSGNQSVVVTVTDNDGKVRSAITPLIVSDAPAVTLTSPVDGGFTAGTQHVAGPRTRPQKGLVAQTISGSGQAVVSAGMYKTSS